MILSLLLLMGMQAELWGRADCHPTTIVLDTAEWCGKSITLGKSSKKLSEIFPEECGLGDQREAIFNAIANEPIHIPAPGFPTSGSITLPDGRVTIAAPEPLDVPAIQEWYAIRCPPCNKHEATICSPPCARTHTTCVDKTRILEHDEQSVPLYWCRKVQTGGKP